MENNNTQRMLLRAILQNAWETEECFCVDNYSLGDLNATVDYLIKHGIAVLPVCVGDTVYKRTIAPCRFGEIPKSIGCAENKNLACDELCDAKDNVVEVKVPDLAFIAEHFMCRRDTCQYFLTREDAEKKIKYNG